MFKHNRLFLIGLSVLLLLLLCGCAQHASQEDELLNGLAKVFADAGYPCQVVELPQDMPVGIYRASVWKALQLDDEQVLVYFDESNRADYLLTMVDQAQYGYATHYGQRFILVYNGTDETILSFLKTL